MELMEGAVPVRKLACGHGFHASCIQRWLRKNASCPLCKAETPPVETPETFKVDLGHQEMTQIMTELEDIFLAVHACAGPDRPVALNGLAYNLCVSLGYEDEDELEEAIGGTLADFLDALPHFDVVWPQAEDVTLVPAEEGAGNGDAPTSEAPVDGSQAPVDCSQTQPATDGDCPAIGDGEEDAEASQQPVATSDLIRATMRPEPPADEILGPGKRITFTVAER